MGLERRSSESWASDDLFVFVGFVGEAHATGCVIAVGGVPTGYLFAVIPAQAGIHFGISATVFEYPFLRVSDGFPPARE